MQSPLLELLRVRYVLYMMLLAHVPICSLAVAFIRHLLAKHRGILKSILSLSPQDRSSSREA